MMTLPPRNLIVRGQANLLEQQGAQADLERIRRLFDDIENKKDLVDMSGLAEQGDGVRIFIGSENRLFSMSGSSLIVAPFKNRDEKICGCPRRHRSHPPQLCPHYSDGRLHRQTGGPSALLIFPADFRYPAHQGLILFMNSEDQLQKPRSRPMRAKFSPIPGMWKFTVLKDEVAQGKDRLLRLAADIGKSAQAHRA